MERQPIPFKLQKKGSNLICSFTTCLHLCDRLEMVTFIKSRLQLHKRNHYKLQILKHIHKWYERSRGNSEGIRVRTDTLTLSLTSLSLYVCKYVCTPFPVVVPILSTSLPSLSLETPPPNYLACVIHATNIQPQAQKPYPSHFSLLPMKRSCV